MPDDCLSPTLLTSDTFHPIVLIDYDVFTKVITLDAKEFNTYTALRHSDNPFLRDVLKREPTTSLACTVRMIPCEVPLGTLDKLSPE